MFAIDARIKVHWSEEIHQETLDAWNQSVGFFNDVNEVINFFPEDIEKKIKDDIYVNALSVTNKIARGYRSDRSDTFKKAIDESIEALHLTLSRLYVAKDWGYVNKIKFYELYQSGALLEKRLKIFKGAIYASYELN